MKALRIHEYAGFDGLRIDDIPVPDIAPDAVLVRVEAACVNPLDYKFVQGTVQDRFVLNLPYTLGTDVAGTIEKVGPLVTSWTTGDRVFGRLAPLAGGAFAEFAEIPAIDIGAVPQGMAFSTAAGIPTACGTGWEALFEIGKLKANQSVLIHAAAGGVGSFAVQLAKLAGAHVIATASGDGIELARSLGADQVIDYKNEDFTTACKDLDLVIDTVGGETQERSFKVLKRGGVMVCITAHADPKLEEEYGVTIFRQVHRSLGSRNDLMAALVSDGKLNVMVDSTFTFSDLSDAIKRVGTKKARGKIIVQM